MDFSLKKTLIWSGAVFIVMSLFIILLVPIIKRNANNRLIGNRLSESFNGRIIEIFSPRKSTPLTHLKIRDINGKIIVIKASKDLISKSEINDSLIKYKDLKEVTLIKKNTNKHMNFEYLNLKKPSSDKKPKSVNR